MGCVPCVGVCWVCGSGGVRVYFVLGDFSVLSQFISEGCSPGGGDGVHCERAYSSDQPSLRNGIGAPKHGGGSGARSPRCEKICDSP
jgi:hypothetical protein